VIRALTRLALAASLAVGAAVAQPPAPAAAPQGQGAARVEFKPFDRAGFETAAQQLGATPAQLEAFGRQAEELGLPRAADALLRGVVPAFDAAVALREADDPKAALELAKVLAATQDPLLQAHVRYHLAQVFLASDDPERATEILHGYLTQNINRSPLDPEAAFFYAQALAELPIPELAMSWFRSFLLQFPDASERFRATAHQRIAEMEQQKSPLHELADGMKKTTRDIRKQKTDKPVQVDQEKFIEKLDELIEMFEEMERQSSGPASGLGPSNAPAASSALPGGESTVGNLNKRPSLADRWGDMKDADRQKIESEVQSSLPPQYRKMLEEYYKKLGAGGGER
jgi:tetratricopeptide (TPR) repeat protein